MPHRLEHSLQEVDGVHDPSMCSGRPCPIHNMSNHHMRHFTQLWRQDRQMMERLCPHGVGHPDPDHLASIAWLIGAEEAMLEGVHGCDGCCSQKGWSNHV